MRRRLHWLMDAVLRLLMATGIPRGGALRLCGRAVVAKSLANAVKRGDVPKKSRDVAKVISTAPMGSVRDRHGRNLSRGRFHCAFVQTRNFFPRPFLVFGFSYCGARHHPSSFFIDLFVISAQALKTNLDKAGILAMGNSGKNSNTSQFFLTLSGEKKVQQLRGKHVVFGELVEGQEVLDLIQKCAGDDEKPKVSVIVHHFKAKLIYKHS